MMSQLMRLQRERGDEQIRQKSELDAQEPAIQRNWNVVQLPSGVGIPRERIHELGG
jgi:hypothetical protein